uniref:Uncharacterized protein n=1 Tax=Glossina austeni TaxID=7395 RepID=A0A1A9VXB1_GLOAU
MLLYQHEVSAPLISKPTQKSANSNILPRSIKFLKTANFLLWKFFTCWKSCPLVTTSFVVDDEVDLCGRDFVNRLLYPHIPRRCILCRCVLGRYIHAVFVKGAAIVDVVMNGATIAGAVAPVVAFVISLKFVLTLGSAEKGSGVSGGSVLWSTTVLNCPLPDVVSQSIASASWSSNEICVVGIVVVNNDLDAAIAASRLMYCIISSVEKTKDERGLSVVGVLSCLLSNIVLLSVFSTSLSLGGLVTTDVVVGNDAFGVEVATLFAMNFIIIRIVEKEAKVGSGPWGNSISGCLLSNVVSRIVPSVISLFCILTACIAAINNKVKITTALKYRTINVKHIMRQNATSTLCVEVGPFNEKDEGNANINALEMH